MSVHCGYESSTIKGIPTGTQCTMSRDAANGSDGLVGTPTFSPSATVTIANKDPTVKVPTTNTLTRDTGSLTMSKSVDGWPGRLPGPFTAPTTDGGTGFPGQFGVANGSSQTINGDPGREHLLRCRDGSGRRSRATRRGTPTYTPVRDRDRHEGSDGSRS